MSSIYLVIMACKFQPVTYRDALGNAAVRSVTTLAVGGSIDFSPSYSVSVLSDIVAVK